MKKRLFGTMLFCAILLSSCATIFTGRGEPRLQITSNPTDARITVYDKMRNVLLEGKTPAFINVPPDSLYVVISKEGYTSERFFIENRRIKPSYWINFISFAAGTSMAGLSYNNFNMYRNAYSYDRELENINRELEYLNRRWDRERSFSQERHLQNFSFASATAKKCMFRSP